MNYKLQINLIVLREYSHVKGGTQEAEAWQKCASQETVELITVQTVMLV
jgi:hypothetical protein